MKGKLGWAIGIGLWMVSLIVVMGSLVLSLTEGGLLPPRNESKPSEETISKEQTPEIEETEAIPEVLFTATSTPPPTLTATHTETPTPTCAYPVGWVITTLPKQTSLADIAGQYGITPEEILNANCLSSAETLSASQTLYLPPATSTPTATETEKPRKPKATQGAGGAKCGPPAHWVIYTVQKGDTLYSIAVQTGATVAELQWANCLGNSTVVRVGQKLYVPRLPQIKLPTATQKPPKSPQPTPPSAPGLTPIIITPLPTASP